jgi:RimJ/RimL family protein N-acetyltransferase
MTSPAASRQAGEDCDMIFRRSHERDLDALARLLVADPANALTARRFEARFRTGEYQTGWIWIAAKTDEGVADAPPTAVGIWWGPPGQDRPAALDALVVAEHIGPGDRVELAAGLLTAAHRAFAQAGLNRPPDFHLFVPADWRDRPDATAAVAWRREAALRAGLSVELERLRFEWTPNAGLPARGRRLAFEPEADDAVFAGLFARVLAGTLDATSRRHAESVGALAQAWADVRFYRDSMLGERSWWRIARNQVGEVAGFGVPSRNTEYPVVGYLGVLPEHRGHSYADEILSEITRILVNEAHATVIHADTDLENRPMAGAFERTGYQVVGRRLVLSAP